MSGVRAVRDKGHSPNLETILMVEKAIRKAKNYPTKKALWQSLPRKTQYPTFNRVMNYLLESNKIILNELEIVWVFPDNAILKRALAKSIRVR